MTSMEGQTPTPARDPDPTATSSSPATPKGPSQKPGSPRGTPRGFSLFARVTAGRQGGCPSLRKPDTLAPAPSAVPPAGEASGHDAHQPKSREKVHPHPTTRRA